jgi:hypothetical protein
MRSLIMMTANKFKRTNVTARNSNQHDSGSSKVGYNASLMYTEMARELTRLGTFCRCCVARRRERCWRRMGH